MIPDKKVRSKVQKKHLLRIHKALKQYVVYSEQQGYQHSIERAKPVLEYVEKKLRDMKDDTVSIQVSLLDIGTIHDSLTDYILFYKGGLPSLLETVEWVEQTFEQKMRQYKVTKSELFTRSLMNVRNALKDGK